MLTEQSRKKLHVIFTARIRSLREGSVFSCVCLSGILFTKGNPVHGLGLSRVQGPSRATPPPQLPPADMLKLIELEPHYTAPSRVFSCS